MLTTFFNGQNSNLCPNGRNSTIVFHSQTSKSQLPGRTPTCQHLCQTRTCQHRGRTPTCQNHRRTQTSQHHGRTQTSQHHGWTPTSQQHGRKKNLWQRTPFSAPVAEAQLSTGIVHSELPTDPFSKFSNSQDHRFRAWRHSHSSFVSNLGFLWQLWLSYPLRTSVNCTLSYAPELRAE